MNRMARAIGILSLTLAGVAALTQTETASARPLVAEVQKSVGFFSGWFQPMDLESTPTPSARDAAAMNRISPGAGTPSASSVNSPPPSMGPDAGGSRILSAIDKCRQIADLAARSRCETRARNKAGHATEPGRPTIGTDDTVGRSPGADQ